MNVRHKLTEILQRDLFTNAVNDHLISKEAHYNTMVTGIYC